MKNEKNTRSANFENSGNDSIRFQNADKKNLTLRRLDQKNDMALLFEIFVSTREDILNYPAWDADQKKSFLNQQFKLQHHAYMTSYDHPIFYIVDFQNKGVGRLYLDIRERDVRIVDTAFLPSARNQGFGTALLTDLLSWAQQHHKTLSIHVEKQNPALHWYRRLGFECMEQGSVYDLMQTPPIRREH
ncbi:MAG: GNAT family N-acetyltransferase [Thiomicrospira sp.]